MLFILFNSGVSNFNFLCILLILKTKRKTLFVIMSTFIGDKSMEPELELYVFIFSYYEARLALQLCGLYLFLLHIFQIIVINNQLLTLMLLVTQAISPKALLAYRILIKIIDKASTSCHSSIRTFDRFCKSNSCFLGFPRQWPYNTDQHPTTRSITCIMNGFLDQH